jgi:hypothetical protein
MSTEHLILGKTVDFITGETLVETHDERARQKIARFLVEEKGYAKTDIERRRKISFVLDGRDAVICVDFVIRIEKKAFAVVMFGPGSLVTRERSTLAAARLAEEYVIPYAVITNGQGAELLDTCSGAVLAHGLEAIPLKENAVNMMASLTFESLSQDRLTKERRVLFAFEVLAERECSEYVCRLY